MVSSRLRCIVDDFLSEAGSFGLATDAGNALLLVVNQRYLVSISEDTSNDCIRLSAFACDRNDLASTIEAPWSTRFDVDGSASSQWTKAQATEDELTWITGIDGKSGRVFLSAESDASRLDKLAFCEFFQTFSIRLDGWARFLTEQKKSDDITSTPS